MRRLLLLCLLLVPASGVWSQTSGVVTGRVVDADDGRPLQGVNVFVANAMLGAATNDQGRYVVGHVPPGTHDLVASMIGYAPVVRSIAVSKADTVTVDFRLTPVVIQNEGVEVVADRPVAWRKNLETFLRLFVGTSPNASDTRILNPEVLDFTRNTSVHSFVATASQPLLIENRGLGYRLTLVLTTFVHKRQGGVEFLSYMGYPHFDEMEPRNEHERRRWATNRMRAYRGSFRHFLRALAAGTAEDEGFEVRLSSWPRTDFSRTDLRALPRVPLDSLVHPAATSYEYAMEMQGAPYLLVRYLRAPEDPAYQRFKGAHLQRYGDQRSYLELRNSLLFNARGYLNNPLDAYTYGYWFWERVPELLPIEYEPPTDAEQ